MTTRKEILQCQERFAAYKNRYKNYPGSPGDDALIGIYGEYMDIQSEKK